MKRFKGTSLLYWTAISALRCAHLYLQQVNLLHFYYVQINFGSTLGFYRESKLSVVPFRHAFLAKSDLRPDASSVTHPTSENGLCVTGGVTQADLM